MSASHFAAVACRLEEIAITVSISRNVRNQQIASTDLMTIGCVMVMNELACHVQASLDPPWDIKHGGSLYEEIIV